MRVIREHKQEDFVFRIYEYPNKKNLYSVFVNHMDDEIWHADFDKLLSANLAFENQMERCLPKDISEEKAEHQKKRRAEMVEKRRQRAKERRAARFEADEVEHESCYCSTTHPPCSFCTSMTEDEVEIYDEGGSELLAKYRRARRNGEPWPPEKPKGPYDENPMFGLF